MKLKKLWRSVLAGVCCVSLLAGNMGSYAKTVSASEPTDAVTPPELEQVTFEDFGIADGTYGYTSWTNPSTGQVYSAIAAQGTYKGGVKNKTFAAKINFGNTGRQARISFGGKSGETGFSLINWTQGRLAYFDPEWAFSDTINYLSGEEQASVFEGLQTVKISFEVVDADDNGIDDVRIWLYIGNTLYGNGPLCVLTDYASQMGDYLGIYFINNDGSSITVESVEPPAPPAESLPTDFTSVTPKEFGLPYDTYEAAEAGAAYPKESAHTKTPVSSMEQVRFDTKLTMGKSTRFIYLKSNNNSWAGLTFILREEGKIWLQNNILNSDGEAVFDGKVWTEDEGTKTCYLDPTVAIEGATTFQDLPFHFSLTTQYVAVDEDEIVDDLKLGVWFDYKLYNEQYFYIKNCKDVVRPGINLIRYSTGNIILESPTPLEPVVTTETYNLSDGPYLVTGTGTITVNGEETANGATITEPGEYQIVSDNGRITRNVTLRKTGSKSAAITYEDGVMPIVGYHGPYNGKDSRGNTYKLISEQSYQLLSAAGINLISKIDMNWADASNRTDIIQSLEYAEKYGMGLYVWDRGLQSGTLTNAAIAEQISQYSQYESFKGIYVTDEPGTSTYNSTWETQLNSYIAQASAVNQYCNLNAYINLFPQNTANGDYSAYVDEYLQKTDGKLISYDYYVYGRTYRPKYDDFYTGANAAGYFSNLSIVREKALKNGIPFWPYVQVGNHWNVGGNTSGMTTTNDSPTREELLWNVNTSLAYGAKGIQYFPLVQPDYFAYGKDNTYDYERNGVLGANGEPTPWYPHIKEANEQIALVDEYLLKATSMEVLAKGTAAQADTSITDEAYGTLQSITVGDTASGAVVGAFAYKGNDMFYVVNYDTTDTVNADKITLNFAGIEGYRLIQKSGMTFGEGETCELTINAGEAVLVILDDSLMSRDGMTCLTPVDYNILYGEYVKADYANGEYGETKGTCAKIDSMDKVLFKTGITMGSSVQLIYMKNSTVASDAQWQGIKLRTNGSGQLIFENVLTGNGFYVQGDETKRTSYIIEPTLALGDANITSWLDVPFYLTLTTEFVAYNGEEADDLKLGIYFNDKLYRDAYIYITDCKDICAPSLFLYRPQGGGSLTLSSPAVFETALRPEITDSIAMTYQTIVSDKLTEAPSMIFEGSEEDLIVQGVQVGAKVWEFTYPEMYAQNMAQIVKATLQIGDYTKTYETSMLDYCAYVLGLEEGTAYTETQLTDLKNLIVDLVQYGEAVQRYRGIDAESDDLLTKKLEAMISNYANDDLTDASDFGTLTAVEKRLTLDENIKDTDKYIWKNVRLVLGNQVKLRYEFVAADITNLTVKASIGRDTYELEIHATETNGIYTVDFDQIYAYEFAKPITVKFYESGEQVGTTVHYSVNTYLFTMTDCVAENETQLSQLLLAIHHYGTAAKLYQNSR